MAKKRSFIEHIIELGATVSKDELVVGRDAFNTLLRTRFGEQKKVRKSGITGSGVRNPVRSDIKSISVLPNTTGAGA